MTRIEIISIVKGELEALSANKIENLDEDIFFKNKLLDSMNLLNLIVFLEQKFDVKIAPFFVDRESVSSINKIADYIESNM